MSVSPGFMPGEVVPFNVWSAALPLTWGPDLLPPRVRLWTLAPEVIRPWNGRVLTAKEVDGCFRAFVREYDLTCCVGYAVQAAYEWLSEHGA